MKKLLSLFAIGAFMFGGVSPAFALDYTHSTIVESGTQTDFDGSYLYISTDGTTINYAKGAYNGYFNTLTNDFRVDYRPDAMNWEDARQCQYKTNGGTQLYSCDGQDTPVTGTLEIDFPALISTSVFKDVRMGDFVANTASALASTTGKLAPIVGLAIALPLLFWVIMKMQETVVEPQKVFKKEKNKMEKNKKGKKKKQDTIIAI